MGWCNKSDSWIKLRLTERTLFIHRPEDLAQGARRLRQDVTRKVLRRAERVRRKTFVTLAPRARRSGRSWLFVDHYSVCHLR